MQHINTTKFTFALLLMLVAICQAAVASTMEFVADEKVSVNVTETEANGAAFKMFVINEIDAQAVPSTLQMALATKAVSYVAAATMNSEYASVIDF